MPFTWVRCSIISASGKSGRRAKSSSPLEVFADRSFKYADFCFDNPAPRICSSLSLRMPSGVSGSPVSPAKRLKSFGRLAVQLLVDDRFGQAVELGRRKLHAARPNALDDRPHDGVDFLRWVTALRMGIYIYHRIALGEQKTNQGNGVNFPAADRPGQASRRLRARSGKKAARRRKRGPAGVGRGAAATVMR